MAYLVRLATLDYIAAIPSNIVADLDRIAGQGSALAKKRGLYLQHVTVADVPEGYADRLEELFPGQFARLRLLALEVHDLVLAKLVRNSPVDLTSRTSRGGAFRLRKDMVFSQHLKRCYQYGQANARHHE